MGDLQDHPFDFEKLPPTQQHDSLYTRVHIDGLVDASAPISSGGMLRIQPNWIKIGRCHFLGVRQKRYTNQKDRGIYAFHLTFPCVHYAATAESLVKLDMFRASVRASDGTPSTEFFKVSQCAARLGSALPHDPVSVARDLMLHAVNRIVENAPELPYLMDLRTVDRITRRADGTWGYLNELPACEAPQYYPDDDDWQPNIAALLNVPEQAVHELTEKAGMSLNRPATKSSPIVLLTGWARLLAIADTRKNDNDLDELDVAILRACERHMDQKLKQQYMPLAAGAANALRHMIRDLVEDDMDTAQTLVGPDHIRAVALTTTRAIEKVMSGVDGAEMCRRFERVSTAKDPTQFFKMMLSGTVGIKMTREKDKWGHNWTMMVREPDVFRMLLNIRAAAP